MSQTEIEKTLSLLFPEGSVVELRALRKTGGMASGYYTDHSRLAHDARALDITHEFSGMYVVLNEINPVLLCRRANRTEMRLSKDDKATSDEDILHRRWFPIDIDPRRPSGISSSDGEHTEALEKAEKIRQFLADMGWPEPVVADSGNGAHLLYRIDLPNDPASGELIKQALTVLSAFFSDERSGIDTSVSKAAQLWKLYGTMAKKGDSVNDRPHRRSRILSSPAETAIVSRELLMQLSSLLPSQPEPVRKKHNLTGESPDLGSWLERYGLSFREKPYGTGRLFLFDQCPFSSAHADGAYAIQFDNGAIFAGCHHTSCGGGTQRWPELRERFEGHRPKKDHESRLKKMAKDRALAKAEYYGNRTQPLTEHPDQRSQNSHTQDACTGPGNPGSLHPAPLTGSSPPALKSPAYASKALAVMQPDDPIRFIKDSVAVEHEGDGIVASCLIMSFASRSVINSNGLHVLVTGQSGKGKSHIFDTMIRHLPPECRLDGRISDKALFYTEELRPGTAICLDDMTLSEMLQETLKGVTTSFKKPFIYRTVNTDRKPQICIIPERCVWWVSKVDGTRDDQVWNRMLTCWIDDTAEQDERVLVRELAAAEALPEEFTEVRDDILICHEIWNLQKPVYVVIPYASRIRFTSSANRRNSGMLLDLIKSHAALHQYQREQIQKDNVSVRFASLEDFNAASRIFHELNSSAGAQSTKLTKMEALLIDVIRRTGKSELTMKELVDLSGKSYDAVRKTIRGRGKDNSYNGLLEKCPAITYLYRTDATDTGSKSQIVYVWNEKLYQLWSSGGGCWLSDADDDDTNHPGFGEYDTVSERTACIPGNVTGETGTEKYPIGEDFRPVKEGRNEFLSQNETQDADLECDRTKLLGAQTAHDSIPVSHTSNLSHCAPADFVRSSENVGTKAISDPVCQSDKESPGQNIVPIPSDQGIISPVRSDTPLSIDPDDYSPINGVWSGPCAVCGQKRVHYTEKFSKRMKEENRFSYRICQTCYDMAVVKKSDTFRALPGLLNVRSMVRAHTDIGRCDVCNTGAAVWTDPDTKQKICQVCYTREEKRSGVLS